MKQPDLTVNIAGIRMRNPVMVASGTFGYGEEYVPFIDLGRLGAIVVKGLSLRPRPGNPPPRVVETPAGMLNAVGLQNIGVEAFLRERLPGLKKYNTPIIANIFGEDIKEYKEVASRLDEVDGIAGLELNISCPNVKKGGVVFGTDPSHAHRVVKAVRKSTTLPLITKLSPNITDIKVIARAVEDAGSDTVSLINTITGMAIDVEQMRPRLANITGGLSGPAIRPIAVRMVWEVAQVVSIPVIGIGGIMSAKDALEFILAGASAIQVGTANFVDPSASIKIIDGIEDYMIRHKVRRITSLVGRALSSVASS
ncbi:MAG: dihydroorotate dehydrogenase [Deltaproteobacteria bacterium]|nr:dihydroorotate dehydrogenase [Deltaproteobacteria bacterium]